MAFWLEGRLKKIKPNIETIAKISTLSLIIFTMPLDISIKYFLLCFSLLERMNGRSIINIV